MSNNVPSIDINNTIPDAILKQLKFPIDAQKMVLSRLSPEMLCAVILDKGFNLTQIASALNVSRYALVSELKSTDILTVAGQMLSMELLEDMKEYDELKERLEMEYNSCVIPQSDLDDEDIQVVNDVVSKPGKDARMKVLTEMSKNINNKMNFKMKMASMLNPIKAKESDEAPKMDIIINTSEDTNVDDYAVDVTKHPDGFVEDIDGGFNDDIEEVDIDEILNCELEEVLPDI